MHSVWIWFEFSYLDFSVCSNASFIEGDTTIGLEVDTVTLGEMFVSSVGIFFKDTIREEVDTETFTLPSDDSLHWEL